MSLVAKIFNGFSLVLVDLFLSLLLRLVLEIGFVARTLVLARSSSSASSCWDSWMMRLLVEKVFCRFCLKFSLSLTLAVGLGVRPDRDFGVLVGLAGLLVVTDFS